MSSQQSQSPVLSTSSQKSSKSGHLVNTKKIILLGQSNQEILPEEKQSIPSWAAYHSLVCQDTRPITNVYVPLLVPAPANEWQTLFIALQQAQHTNTQAVGPGRKTVITLDMDLYSRALKLQTLKPDMHKNVILRIGEVHTVLCTMRALGSTIV